MKRAKRAAKSKSAKVAETLAAMEMASSKVVQDVVQASNAKTMQRVADQPDVALEGADAEAYVEKKLNDLAPYAMFVLHRDLLDDTQPAAQREAARQILDRRGFSKTERHGQSQAPVVVLIGDSAIRPPWMKNERTVAVSLPASAEAATVTAAKKDGDS